MRFDTEDISKILQNPRSLQTVIGVVLILLAFSSGVTAGEYSYSMESGLLRFALFVVGLGLIFVPMYVQIKTSGIVREGRESVRGHADKMAAIGKSALIHADILATWVDTSCDAVRGTAVRRAGRVDGAQGGERAVSKPARGRGCRIGDNRGKQGGVLGLGTGEVGGTIEAE